MASHLLPLLLLFSLLPLSFSSPPANFSTHKTLAAAILSTAATTFAISFLIFFTYHRLSLNRLRSHSPQSPLKHDQIAIDLLYLRTLDLIPPIHCDRCKSLLQQSPDQISSQQIAAPPPPPPPPPVKRGPPPPPPPIPPARKPGGVVPVRRSGAPPVAPDGGKDRPRMKPLHWEKVTPANSGHSMVWDKITGGSIRFDDDLIESLFGYAATNHSSSASNPGNQAPDSSPGGATFSAGGTAQIRLLEPRKSQNIAIILRTLAVSRQEILDGLQDGHSLAADTLDKLHRIALTSDEESAILSFTGNPSRLADAESFIFHILRAVPSAFPRIAALHFRRSAYEPEILHLRQSLRTLDLACKELRTQQLFLKLLEAILKAGNRMNAGTSRGNAQAFDLSALRKLSDVKSTDGKTTLLHFVVEEVVRSEGKSCAALNRSNSIRRSVSRNTTEPEAYRQLREEREREYMILGLPIVGGLSVDFANVKKAAAIDHESLAGSCAFLAARVSEIRGLLRSWKENDGEFVNEMTRFVEEAAREIERVKEEQIMVMEKVRRTTEYYQPAASKDTRAHPLQLFVIVRDFLAMVDQACVDITRKLQKKRLPRPQAMENAAPTVVPPSAAEEEKTERLPLAKLPSLKEERITTRFPNLPARFLSDNSISSSDSEEDDGFIQK